MHYDVAIIGAGFSGLAAGIRLAHFGRRVCILEKHSVWGGLNSFYKKGGHHFDTGLHAVTNWVHPNRKGPRVPLQRIARQLRISIDDFELCPQSYSEVRFCGTGAGGVALRFTNDIAFLEEEIRRRFPGEIDGFVRLEKACAEYPDFSKNRPHVSARKMLEEYVRDPLLREMLLAPALYYGSAEENDIDFEQFIILFKSILEEGFARPKRGIRSILDVLVDKYRTSGGVLMKGTGVERLGVAGARVSEIVLEGGERLTADMVISSAGLVETMRLRSDSKPGDFAPLAGQLAFIETIWVLDAPARDATGHQACITFFSEGEVLKWSTPDDFVDLTSGVICCPSNYDFGSLVAGDASGEPPETCIRATHLASWKRWFEADAGAPIGEGKLGRGVQRPARTERYRAEKRAWMERSKSVVSRWIGRDFSPRVVYEDAFTPNTVRHFTQKVNGAIYGSPYKQKSGTTDLANLFLCGTDQGLVGIVGAMLSGIGIANAFGLASEREVVA
jgi:phytoene dehydrogenase-like protein